MLHTRGVIAKGERHVVFLFDDVHDEENIDEPPDAAAAASDEFQGTQQDVAGIESVNAVAAQEDGEQNGNHRVLGLCKTDVGTVGIELLQHLAHMRNHFGGIFAGILQEEAVNFLLFHE